MIGAGAAYVFDLRKSGAERREITRQRAREQRQIRASVATALIQDLRGLETMLRQFFHAKKPATWIGQRPSLYFDVMRENLRLFAPDSVPTIDEFYRRVDSLFTTLEAAPDTKRSDELFNHAMRVQAGFSLQSLPDAKAALVREGGSIPEPRVLEFVQYPDLPSIPSLSFPDVPASGEEMPDELR